MLTFRDYSITKKLSIVNLLINILVIGAVLFLACLVIGSYDLNAFRANLMRNLSIQSQIIAANSASALRLHDTTSATVILATLKAYPSILSGVIYTPAGEPLATYARTARGSIPPPVTMAAGQTEKHWTAGKEYTQMRSVVFQGKVIGAVLLQADLRATNDRMGRYAGIVALVLFFSLPAAFLLLVVLQRAATRPILQLAETARIVSREKNYSVRVSATTRNDEAGLLITAFNEMLVQIQERDAALQKALDLNRNILDSSTEYSIVGKDLDGNILLWNEGARRHYGYEPEEVIGRANASILYSPRMSPKANPRRSWMPHCVTANGRARSSGFARVVNASLPGWSSRLAGTARENRSAFFSSREMYPRRFDLRKNFKHRMRSWSGAAHNGRRSSTPPIKNWKRLRIRWLMICVLRCAIFKALRICWRSLLANNLSLTLRSICPVSVKAPDSWGT